MSVEVRVVVHNLDAAGVRLYRHLRQYLGIPRHEANFIMLGIALTHMAQGLSPMTGDLRYKRLEENAA